MKQNTSDFVIQIEGQIHPVSRAATGLWSLDRALGFGNQLGMPLRTICEIYGRPGSGKSTLSQYLAGRVLATGKIVIADLENALEPDYLRSSLAQSGFTGIVRRVDMVVKGGGKEPRAHEEVCRETIDSLMQDDVSAVIIDSLGLFASRAELAGEIGDANMGIRAREIAQLSRRATAWLGYTEQPKAVFAVNHVLESMGATSRGHYTPGGQTKEFAAGARIMMWRKDNDFPDGCFQAEMKMEKLRYGGTRRDELAQVFIIPGLGISVGLTAVFDCFRQDLANRGAVVKLGGKSYGRIGALIDAARKGENEMFQAFKDALP